MPAQCDRQFALLTAVATLSTAIVISVIVVLVVSCVRFIHTPGEARTRLISACERLNKRAVRRKISGKGEFGRKPRSGRAVHPLVDLVPRHAGELSAAAGLTGRVSGARPNDSAS